MGCFAFEAWPFGGVDRFYAGPSLGAGVGRIPANVRGGRINGGRSPTEEPEHRLPRPGHRPSLAGNQSPFPYLPPPIWGSRPCPRPGPGRAGVSGLLGSLVTIRPSVGYRGTQLLVQGHRCRQKDAEEPPLKHHERREEPGARGTCAPPAGSRVRSAASHWPEPAPHWRPSAKHAMNGVASTGARQRTPRTPSSVSGPPAEVRPDGPVAARV